MEIKAEQLMSGKWIAYKEEPLWKLENGDLKKDVPETPESRYYGDNLILTANHVGVKGYVKDPKDAELIVNAVNAFRNAIICGRPISDIVFVLGMFDTWYGPNWTQERVMAEEQVNDVRKMDDRTRRDIWYEANTDKTSVS